MQKSSTRYWINFLTLVPSTLVTLLVISVAFLRFYDQNDFEFLRIIHQPRIWSNRFTMAALLAALANFGIEWNRRNRETDRLAAEEQRRTAEEQRRTAEEQRRVSEERRRVAQERAEEVRRAEEERRRVAQERAEEVRRAEEEQRRAEERERSTRRARIETRCRIAQIQFQLDPDELNRRTLIEVLALLEEYGTTF